jgi:hypothetical protein
MIRDELFLCTILTNSNVLSSTLCMVQSGVDLVLTIWHNRRVLDMGLYQNEIPDGY